MMEVHHHAHPVDTGPGAASAGPYPASAGPYPASAGNRKKKWRHYLWEFVMLFLAVFCGFLAEYQLEHKIEKERVKKLMHDMVENLKYDTTRIGRNTPDNSMLLRIMDTLRFEIKEAIHGRANNNRLYYYYLRCDDFGNAIFNKAAITQLKSSGVLRLVKDDSLVNDMLDYYERRVNGSEEYYTVLEKAQDEMSSLGMNVFKTTDFDFVNLASDESWNASMGEQYRSSVTTVLNMKDLKLLSTAPIDLEKLHSAISKLQWSVINYNRFLNFAKDGAAKLIADIEKEY